MRVAVLRIKFGLILLVPFSQVSYLWGSRTDGREKSLHKTVTHVFPASMREWAVDQTKWCKMRVLTKFIFPANDGIKMHLWIQQSTHKRTNAGVLSIDLRTRVLMMTATVKSVTVEPIMESAEEFAAESAIAEVRGIAVASVVPTSVETSRQAENRNQKGTKDNQFYSHYLMRRQAGRMTSEAEDIPFTAGLATAGLAFRTPAGVPTWNLSYWAALNNAIFSGRSHFQMILLPGKILSG
jgi:hypothetical protein